MRQYRISLFGEFTDKSMEDEYLADSLTRSTKLTAYIALVFGSTLGLFLVHSYITERNTPLFAAVAPLRLGFILVSLLLFLLAKTITKPKHLRVMITFYQAIMAIVYLLTLKQYDSLNFFSVLGLMVITLAIYLLPNKITISQIISLVFTVAFFASPSQKLEGLTAPQFFRIIAYQTILLTYCNINYCWTETTKRKAFLANRELLDLSSKDPLTGAYNRKKFDDALDEWLHYSKTYGSSFALIMFDIDNFKEINDHHGHIVGDSVLQNLADVVREYIRETDVFARWGGDEFAILLPHTDLRRAQEVAERIRQAINSNASLQEITCSFGVAASRENDTKQSLLRRADDLLLQAKTAGKDMVVG